MILGTKYKQGGSLGECGAEHHAGQSDWQRKYNLLQHAAAICSVTLISMVYPWLCNECAFDQGQVQLFATLSYIADCKQVQHSCETITQATIQHLVPPSHNQQRQTTLPPTTQPCDSSTLTLYHLDTHVFTLHT